MDSTVDSLSAAYEEFVVAASSVLEAKEQSGGQKTATTDTALESFKDKWELFRIACDRAEEFVESMKQRIGSECLIDEATGMSKPEDGTGGSTTIQPISAVRLEQTSKAVRWLVIELQQHGGGGGGGGGRGGSGVAGVGGTRQTDQSPPGAFDSRFSEDATGEELGFIG